MSVWCRRLVPRSSKSVVVVRPLLFKKFSSTSVRINEFDKKDDNKLAAGSIQDGFLNHTVSELIKSQFKEYADVTASDRFLPTKLNPGAPRLYDKKFSVTDLSGQYCELLKFYDLILTPSVRETTKAMDRGTEIHKMLETAANRDDNRIIVSKEGEILLTKEDVWATKLLNLYAGLRDFFLFDKVREVYVFGILNDELVTGYIDLLQRTDNDPHRIKLVDSKSRSRKSLPGVYQQITAYHQLLIYHKLFRQMIDGETNIGRMFEILELDPDRELNTDLIASAEDPDGHLVGGLRTTTLRSLIHSLQESVFARYQKHSFDLMVEYITMRGRGENKEVHTVGKLEYDYDEKTLRQVLDYSLGFWRGTRDSIGVSVEEIDKCKSCKLQEKCEWTHKLQQTSHTT